MASAKIGIASHQQATSALGFVLRPLRQTPQQAISSAVAFEGPAGQVYGVSRPSLKMTNGNHGADVDVQRKHR
ncbi:hypothetical protein BN1723_002866 [Verticillium longisporum]|uniref:Uncharacterized protein n=1 Tax=Verticillium longisporum TaxID=100787 RepID=A0A0G4LK47_VERLO|nr:hypothetical protein BN1723_002866 [Verticillium longisporum]